MYTHFLVYFHSAYSRLQVDHECSFFTLSPALIIIPDKYWAQNKYLKNISTNNFTSSLKITFIASYLSLLIHLSLFLYHVYPYLPMLPSKGLITLSLPLMFLSSHKSCQFYFLVFLLSIPSYRLLVLSFLIRPSTLTWANVIIFWQVSFL